jgi:hypothetical protein
MSVTQAALMSLEEYLDTVYRPDREYVDGHLERRNLGEYDHGALQAELAFWSALTGMSGGFGCCRSSERAYQ